MKNKISVRALIFCLLVSCACQADMVPFGTNGSADTAEYALGSHTLNVIFIQDDLPRDPNDNTHPVVPGGEVIHWTPAELSSRSQRVINAAAFWTDESASRHHPGAQLDVSVNFLNDGQPFTVADIGGEGSSLGYVSALAQIDPVYAGLPAQEAARRFNHATRQQLGTNWASTVFVKPYNGRASAFINGPYVNAYEDDSTWTHAHEYGHTFGARDEYGSAVTSTRSGYLHEFNTNAVNLPDGTSNPDSIPAVMRTRDIWTISDGTLGQIGWRDSDGDTIPDILDTTPTLLVDTTDSDPALGFASIDLASSVAPLPSPDPAEGDYTINTIEGAEYRVNGGAWQSLIPVDDLFGDYLEDFTIELSGLSLGAHDIDMRVFNSVDNFGMETFSFVSTLVSADFNGDLLYDCADVDALVAEIAAGSNDPAFDLVPDGLVNSDDLMQWLTDAGAQNLTSGNPYLLGDANLDGVVDGIDFVEWNENKFTTTAAWCSGDFNADGTVDAVDFIEWNVNKFTSSGALLVPEPSGWCLLMACTACTLALTGRRPHREAKTPAAVGAFPR